MIPLRRTPLVLVLLLALLLPAAGTLTSPAQAAARVTVTNEFGRAEADLTYSTRLTVSGSGFQSVAGGHGGIYVLFGWVSGSGWQPSQGGAAGGTYRYVPDTEAAQNGGFQRFVAFPGGDTAGSANGGQIGADGRWSTDLVVPGPTFQTLDRAGAAVTIDCREVTCGVITVGAHGVVNAANETFSPLTFGTIFDTAPAGSPAPAAPPAAGTPAAGGSGTGGTSAGAGPAAGAPAGALPAAGVAPPPGEPVAPGVLIDPTTAAAGRVLSFTAVGLIAGEQVLATLDDGVASVGPLPVTDHGTVAGLLELPDTLAGGNHELRLTGTTTGGLPVLTFAIESDAGALSVTPASASTELPSGPALVAFVGAAALFLVVVTVAVTAAWLRPRHARTAAAARTATPSPAGVRS
jgi:hypothetical protein